MIVVFPDNQGANSLGDLASSLAELGGDVHRVTALGGLPLFALSGLDSSARLRLDELPGVLRSVDCDEGYGFVTRGVQAQDSSIEIAAGLSIGGGCTTVIAGPCSVESSEQLQAVARGVAQAGAQGLRGGAFKPRSSPYSFQGLGERGLELLSQAREATGLPVVTEVMSAEEVPLVARYADLLQVGARNVQNFRLLAALGEIDKPVLLKRGMMSTIDEYLGAAEYIYLRGNPRIILCERGVRSFEPRMRNLLDLGSVALLKRLTHLPVLVDPSHACGLRELVPDLGLAGLAAGADGLLVEVHPEPSKALSDGRQSLEPSAFAEMMRKVSALAELLGRPLPRAAGRVAAVGG